MSGETPKFMPGDVIFCPGGRTPPHVLTRWITQAHDEHPTYAVHTAQFLSPRRIIEIQTVARKRSTREFLQMRKEFEVWRCNSLTPSERQAVARKSLDYLGRSFGWPKLFTHLLDGLVNKVSHKQVYFFRRLNHDERYPICSWITAYSYDRAAHYRFGAPPDCADPDQIHDWVTAHPGEWVCVFSLEPASKPSPARPTAGAVPAAAR